MRLTLIIALLTTLSVSCGSRMQQLESAGEKVKQCVNDCSLGTNSVSDSKKGKVVSSQTATDEQQGGGDRVSNGWTNRLNLW
jgi:hypothetical protein